MNKKVHKPKLKPAIALAAICVCAVLMGIGVLPLWAAQPEIVPEKGEPKSNITVEADGTIIHYQN